MPGPLAVDWAQPGDAEAISDVLRQGAAWMKAKGSPAWTEAMVSIPVVEAAIARGEFLAAKAGGVIVGVCTLSRTDPLFWPEDTPGEAAYIHRLAVRRDFAGRRVTPVLVAACEAQARAWDRRFLRLDCHRLIRPVYDALGFAYVDTREVCESPGMRLIVDRLQRPL